MSTQSHPLGYYLALEYPYTVIPDDGSFFVEFPDLPNCFTQVDDASEIAAMAEEIRTLWIESEYEAGATIPEPSTDSSYSGKFVTRVPKSLHRDLALAAKGEGMSLNAYVGYLLAERAVASRLDAGLARLESHLSSLGERLPYQVDVDRDTAPAIRTRTIGEVNKPRIVLKAVAA